jgi:hypothetical protein
MHSDDKSIKTSAKERFAESVGNLKKRYQQGGRKNKKAAPRARKQKKRPQKRPSLRTKRKASPKKYVKKRAPPALKHNIFDV